MQRSIYAFLGVAMISISGGAQTLEVYTDAFDSLGFEWSHGGTLSRSTTGAFEGTKCLDWSYKTVNNGWDKDSMELGLRPTKGTAYYEWYPAKGYTYYQFAVKASNPENIQYAEFGLWCMHCLTPDGDGNFHFKERIPLTLTTSWQVISTPMSVWASNPLDKISIFTFYFVPKKGAATTAGHIYFDDVKFTNTAVDVKPKMQHAINTTGQVIFPQGGSIKFDIYALNGAHVSSCVVELASNAAYNPSQYIPGKLPAGAYFIRQRIQSGGAASILGADRYVAVRN
jgi:hypothetical protein